MKVRIENGITSFVPENESELRMGLRMSLLSERVKQMATSHTKNEKTKERVKYTKSCKFINADGSVCGRKVRGMNVHLAWHGGKGNWGRHKKVEVAQLASETRTV